MAKIQMHDAAGYGFDMSDFDNGLTFFSTDNAPEVTIIDYSWLVGDTYYALGAYDTWPSSYGEMIVTEVYGGVVMNEFNMLDAGFRETFTSSGLDVFMSTADAISGATDWFLFAMQGDDRMIGNNFRDIIKGAAGDDVIEGNGGNDKLYGESGHDDLYGGSGADVLIGGSGVDWLEGGGGNDRLGGGADRDWLWGGTGNDALSGGGSMDKLWGESGRDDLNGGFGNDVLSGGTGGDKLRGGSGNDRFYGNGGWDRLYGEDGKDVLNGGGGKDRLDGGFGNDRLAGGAGADSFLFRWNDGDDRITDFAIGSDLIEIASGAARFGQLDISDTANGALVEFGRASVLLEGVDADALDASDFLF